MPLLDTMVLLVIERLPGWHGRFPCATECLTLVPPDEPGPAANVADSARAG